MSIFNRQSNLFKKLFFILLIFSNPVLAEPVEVITGFDDVLRQAENTSLLRASLKIFEPDKTFAGMPVLYQSLVNDNGRPRKIFLVSAISNMFQTRIDGFLRDSKYPAADFYLRSWLTEWSIENFKNEKIEQILKSKPQSKFIVIFDNSEPSLVLAKEISKKYADRVTKIYLRKTVEKEMPAEAVSFVTAFDIAWSEFNEKHLDILGLQQVALMISLEDDAELIIPSYAYCPKDYSLPCPATNPDSKWCSLVVEKVRKICADRK